MKSIAPIKKQPTGYNEYLLVLKPHEELWNKILNVKKEFHDAYKAPTALWGKQYLPLVSFLQREIIEEKMINSLKIVAKSYHPFKIELKDFGSFPSHTIYLNVETRQTIKNLVKEIKPMRQFMKADKEHKPYFLDNPHFTIAGKLLPWQYEQGWREYSQKHFTGRFMADNMLLLKKVEGRGRQIVQRFEFMNLPVSTKQGELFGAL